MRIDAHQHYWHFDAERYAWIGTDMSVLRRDCLPGEAHALMHGHGIDHAVAVQARCDEAETDWLLGLAAAAPHIAGVVGWVDLRADDVTERLARWQDSALCGIRHIVQDDPSPAATLADAGFARGVHAVQRAGLVYEVLVHADDLAAAVDFCARHDDHLLLLDHAGKPDIASDIWQPWAQQLQALAAMRHVACKLSGLVTEAGAGGMTRLPRYAAHVLDCFGPARTLFGSDWPVCTLAASYAEVLALAERACAELSAAEYAQVFGGNARRIYRLAAHAGA